MRLAEAGRGLFGLTYLLGAVVNLANWVRDPSVYAEITPYILLDGYRDLWVRFVVPNLGVLVPVLALFEAVLGVLILRRGRDAKLGLGAAAVFQLLLAPLGFWGASNVLLAAGHAALLRYEYPDDWLTALRSPAD